MVKFKNKKLEKFVVSASVTIGIVVIPEIVALADDLSKLDEGGNRILIIIRRIGYWIILIKCIADLIKCGINGDTKSIGKTIMLYLMIYAALYFVPMALRLVEGIF
jgi:hypothetical protein